MSEQKRAILRAGVILLMLVVLSLGLAWVSNGYQGFNGWASFLVLCCFGVALLYAGWRLLHHNQGTADFPPLWLLWLALAAFLLRLAAGVVWVVVLPQSGYGSAAEKAGYVMGDAYIRDTTAWELAQSGKPLWLAFASGTASRYSKGDQYGGMLFLSATTYRVLGNEVHQPLLIVVVTAAFSALGVLFTWAVARWLWPGAATLAAWGLAIYPEAVLLGSSQMREAFLISLVAIALWGLLSYYRGHARLGLFWVIASLLASLFFSPPATALLVVSLGLIILALDEWNLLRRRGLWLVLGILTLMTALGIWLAWSKIAPQGVSNILELVRWWLRKASLYQAQMTAHASGWLQREFRKLPPGLHFPVVVIWGVLQPFLPAALVALGAPIWRGIAIWRASGWIVLLLSLAYAAVRIAWDWFTALISSWRNGTTRRPLRVRGPSLQATIVMIVWALVFLASVRGGGDQWDNPRYRAILVSLQVTLSAWVWETQRLKPSPWLRRVLIGSGFVLFWFLPWYIRRYTGMHWEVISIYQTIGLGLASAILYVLWDWVRCDGKS